MISPDVHWGRTIGAWMGRMRANAPTHNSVYGNPNPKTALAEPCRFLLNSCRKAHFRAGNFEATLFVHSAETLTAAPGAISSRDRNKEKRAPDCGARCFNITSEVLGAAPGPPHSEQHSQTAE
jgi:hypothetical protein